MSQPKKHHFVPVCYLRKFKMQGPLKVLDIERLKKYNNEVVRSVEPRGICYDTDYYKLTSALRDGLGEFDVHDLFIETNLLRSLEEKYDVFFNGIVCDRQMSKDDTMQFCDFIVLLKTRNPYWHKKIIEPNKEKWTSAAVYTLRQEIEEDAQISAIGNNYRELIFSIAKRKFIDNPNFSRQTQLRGLFFRHANTENRNAPYRQLISTCGWALAESPSNGPYFITSDNPGISIGRDNLYYNTRFTDGFIFYLPLSPKYCLVISDQFETTDWAVESTKKIDVRSVDEAEVHGINNHIAQRINKLLIAGEADYLNKIAHLNRPGIYM